MIIRGNQRLNRARTTEFAALLDDIPSVSDVAGHPPWPPPPPLASRCNTTFPTPQHTNPTSGTRNPSRRLSRSNPGPVLELEQPASGLGEGAGIEGAVEDLNETERWRERVRILEKNIEYLKEEHSRLLEGLHEEVDTLKRRNRELQFCFVRMQHQQQQHQHRHMAEPQAYSESVSCTAVDQQLDNLSVKDSASQRAESACDEYPPLATDQKQTVKPTHTTDGVRQVGVQLDTWTETMVTETETGKYEECESRVQTNIQCQAVERLAELRSIFFEQEMKQARRDLDVEKHRNQQLIELLHRVQRQAATVAHRAQATGPNASASATSTATKPLSAKHLPDSLRSSPPVDSSICCGPPHVGLPLPQLPFNATLDPLLVQIPPQRPRPPTWRECQIIVRYLQTMVNRQAHELTQLKTDLHDVLYSHKWTPDAYLLARAYIAEDERRVTPLQTLEAARVPMKHATKKLPDYVYETKDPSGTGALLSIKPIVGVQSIERQRRIQELHRLKLNRPHV